MAGFALTLEAWNEGQNPFYMSRDHPEGEKVRKNLVTSRAVDATIRVNLTRMASGKTARQVRRAVRERGAAITAAAG
jgi:hypothetical protein